MSEILQDNRNWLLYITTDKTNGWVYGGYHHGYKTDKYIGSGISFTRKVYEHGKENFERRWIKKTYSSQTTVKQAEVRLIRHLHAFFKGKCYNVHAGGTGGDVLLYGTAEQKQARNDAITKGKLAQYEKGFTEQQVKFFKRHSIHLKYRNQHDQEFIQKMSLAQQERGKRLSERIKEKGYTQNEIDRMKKWGTKQPYTIKIIYPDKTEQLLTDITNTILMKQYHIEDQILLPLIRNKTATIKRRTSRTSHNYPAGTILEFCGYQNLDKLKSNSIINKG